VEAIMGQISGGVRIVVGNDANAAMLAEMWVGSGRARPRPQLLHAPRAHTHTNTNPFAAPFGPLQQRR
jgi:hypothetical protein